MSSSLGGGPSRLCQKGSNASAGGAEREAHQAVAKGSERGSSASAGCRRKTADASAGWPGQCTTQHELVDGRAGGRIRGRAGGHICRWAAEGTSMLACQAARRPAAVANGVGGVRAAGRYSARRNSKMLGSRPSLRSATTRAVCRSDETSRNVWMARALPKPRLPRPLPTRRAAIRMYFSSQTW